MSARILNFSEEQWRQECAKRTRWQRGSEIVVVGEANAHDVGAADGPKRKPGKPKVARLEASAAGDVYRIVALCKAEGLPVPIPEYAFAAPARKWRADYCWPLRMVIVEIEGGVWRKGGGAHSHPSNILRDLEKYNGAAMLGFRVLRYTPEQIGECLRDLRRTFA